MFPRTVLLLLLSCVASSLALELVETTTEAGKLTSLSEVEILLSIAACAFASIAVVIVPTMLYYKFCGAQLQHEDDSQDRKRLSI